MDTTVAPENGQPGSFMSSSAAVVKDSTRKFIRTADIKFRVKDVLGATYQIENVVNRFDGFVTYTNLKSDVAYTEETQVSADSTLETTYFTVVNNITLRVPNSQLDTTLKSIAGLVDFMDYRIIKADDVALDILANQMEQKRLDRHQKRLTDAIDRKGKQLEETDNSEDNLLRKQEQGDASKIETMRLTDKIEFSTVNLDIYQRQEIRRELLGNQKNIAAYEPSFLLKLKEALLFGWNMLEAILLFVVRIWGFLAFALAAYFIYRFFSRRRISKV